MIGLLINVYFCTLIILIPAVLVHSERANLYLQNTQKTKPSQINIQHVQKQKLGSGNGTSTEELKKRAKRDTQNDREPDITHVSLHDNHTSAFISWAGTTEYMVVLTTSPGRSVPSRLYVSNDRGHSFEQKAGQNSSIPLHTSSGTTVNIDKMYHSPQANDYSSSAKHYVFTDKVHNVLVTTRNLLQYTVRQLSFKPSSIDFHPRNDEILIGHDEEHLYVSLNYGFSWTTLARNVKSYYWGPGGDTIYASVLVSSLYSGSSYDVKKISLSGSFSATTLTSQAVDFILKDSYMFVTKKINRWSSPTSHNHLNLFVSKDNGNFQKAEIPTTFGSHLEFLVVDVERDRVMVCVTHHSNSTHLYVSDVTGTQYTLSLPNVVYYSDLVVTSSWMRYLFKEPFADMHKVGGLRGIFIASQWTNNATNTSIFQRPQATRITYDKGGIWTHLVAPFRDSQAHNTYCSWYTGCTLHLIGKFQMGVTYIPTEPILSSANAPGVIMGEGVLGSQIKSDNISLYLSTDAGFTWKEVQKGDQLFNMGDHGNFIVETASRRITNEILYSYDEGTSWKWKALPQSVIVYGVLTKPGSKTGQFSLWGSFSSSNHSWEVIQVNLTSMYLNTTTNTMNYCQSNDYKLWTPGVNVTGNEICLLGETDEIERKIPTHFCLNGETYVRDNFNKTCKCERIDYECDYGYIRDDEEYNLWNVNPKWYDTENSTCTRFNVSQVHGVPSSCPLGSTYNVSKGYRKIAGDVCSGGNDHLYDPIVRNCPRDERRQYILFAAGRNIYRYMLETHTTHTVKSYASYDEIVAVDYDYNNDTLYWADNREDAIKYIDMSDEYKPTQTLIQGNAGKVECITFDWESGNLYFVDATTPKIEVVSIRRGFRRTVVHNNMTDENILGLSRILDLPRALDIAPLHGLMFWTDWSPTHPRVMKASMTGYNISILIDTSEHLGFPNGLAVDVDQEKIYVIDGQTHKILRTDYFGSSLTVLVHNSYYVNQPYGFAVYRDRLFWSDWGDKRIKSVLKESGSGYYYIVDDFDDKINAIKAIHYDGQYITNNTGCGAGNGGCSNICVPHVSNITTGQHRNRLCLCPDNTRPSNHSNLGNELSCICSDRYLTWNISTGDCMPASGAHCNTTYEYQCARGNCISATWRCDGDNDCHDLSDETNCESKACTNEQFSCKIRQRCISKTWVCDGDNDCGDLEDEQNCPAPNCTSSQFACEGGRCIPGSYQCDGMVDCYGGDDSDERNCNTSTTAPCTPPQFQCSATRYALSCLPATWKCDGEQDCDDGSDEVNCASNLTCHSFTEFSCGVGGFRHCVPASYRCDGDNDCGNGVDEAGCWNHTTTPVSTTTDCEFRCSDGTCYNLWAICDGYRQCPDGRDEQGCATGYNYTTARPYTTTQCEFICNSTRTCLPAAWKCDGYADCPDGSDEADCLRCPSDHIACSWSANICILTSQQCDGIEDCTYGEDEIFCFNNTITTTQQPHGCSGNQYSCDGYHGLCINNNQICNGLWDCPSGDDEEQCGFSPPFNLTLVGQASSRTATIAWASDVKNKTNLQYKVQYRHVFDIHDETRSQTHLFMDYATVNTAQVVIKGLTPASNYEVQVKFNRSHAAYSKPFRLSTAEDVPGPVDNLHVTQLANSWAIQFNYPALPNGRLTEYIIQAYRDFRTILNVTTHVSATENRLKSPFYQTYQFSLYGLASYMPITFSVAAATGAGVGNFTNITHCTYLPEPNVTVSSTTDSTVVLRWYKTEYKTHLYDVGQRSLEIQYTDLDRHVVRKNMTDETYTVSGLSPGHDYDFVIHIALTSFCMGSSTNIHVKTKGMAVSRVTDVKVVSGSINATSAKLTWTPINGTKTYEVVLAHLEETFRIGNYTKRVKTQTPNITLTDLHSCQAYEYAVRSETPIGPLSIQYHFRTLHDPTAAVNSVDVNIPDNITKYRYADLSWMSKTSDKVKANITWYDPCALSHNMQVYYIITITLLNVKSVPTRSPVISYQTNETSITEELERGGDYEIVIMNTNKLAKSTTSTQLIGGYPEPIAMPEQIDYESAGVAVTLRLNLKYTSTKKDTIPCRIKVETKSSDSDVYTTQSDVLTTLNDFINVNLTTPAMYKVSLQYVRYDNLRNAYFSKPFVYYTSTVHLQANQAQAVELPKSKTGMYIGIGVSVVVVLVLVVVLGVYCFKHKRLQQSFAQFTMSRYNSRTDSTTLGGDDDDSPIIQGFADDEPLVVA